MDQDSLSRQKEGRHSCSKGSSRSRSYSSKLGDPPSFASRVDDFSSQPGMGEEYAQSTFFAGRKLSELVPSEFELLDDGSCTYKEQPAHSWNEEEDFLRRTTPQRWILQLPYRNLLGLTSTRFQQVRTSCWSLLCHLQKVIVHWPGHSGLEVNKVLYLLLGSDSPRVQTKGFFRFKDDLGNKF